ncbi:hypothetical protein DER44DRAFT_828726 [Fusarium oxysporum]|nr:hypothetical protein DER44DRAFT_828726 [Fusarium oxysporum]
MPVPPYSELPSPGDIPEGWPLTGPLFSIPTRSGPPIPTKTPFTDKRPDHKANRLPLKEEPTPKEDKELMPGHNAVHGPAHALASATSFERPGRLGTAGVSHITGIPLRPPPIAGKTVVQNRQSEDEAYEYTGLLVFLIVILLGAAFGGCLLLMRLVASVSRRLGRRYGWKWVKRADSADLEDAIYYWKDHPDVFEQYHLDLLREILASYGGSSYLPVDEKAAEMGRLDSTDCAPLPGPRPVHMAPSQSGPCWPGMPGYRYSPHPMGCP